MEQNIDDHEGRRVGSQEAISNPDRLQTLRQSLFVKNDINRSSDAMTVNRVGPALLVLAGLLFITSTVSARPAVPSPAEYLGYELGERWTPHHKVIGYFKQVAAASPMVEWQRYGTTYEGRELIIVTVSTAGNLDRKEEIRTNNLKRAGLLPGTPTEDTTAIVWLSYNVHGNEASSSEAAMKTLYELVRPNNARAKKWLSNTLVIMDPMLNPDGRERYVHWYEQTVGKEPNAEEGAREHHEPWPGGRTNHYYFDLNRDWAWLTQQESRQRIRLFQSWLPHVHVDFHEQEHNSPYYFAPAAEPFHKAITEWQRQFQYTIGRNHARYFDRNNWLYFTREIFDLFYPSYGDTYPIFNGSIGMTYEQAGQVGLEIVQADGDTLTLKDRLLHHHTTGISTVEIVSENAERVVREFGKYYRDARRNPAGKYKTYVITGNNDPDKLRNLLELLDRHKVRYGKAPHPGTYDGFDYQTGEIRRVSVSADDYLVSAYQPKSVLARIFFEPRPELSDSVTYDITAWGQHYAFGLEGYALTQRLETVEAEPPATEATTGRTLGEPYAYLAEWRSQTDLKLLAYLLQEGIQVRFATERFVIDGTAYRPGTLIITRNGNTDLGIRFDRVVRQAAVKFRQPLVPVASGFTDFGPDFGSETVRYIDKPRIVLLSGRGTDANNVGEIWHFFDRQIEYPVTLIDTGKLDEFDLGRYDLLVMPDGSYDEVFDRVEIDRIREWVKKGGRLIALRSANGFLAGRGGFGLERKKAEKIDSTRTSTEFKNSKREQISRSNSGSIFKITMDPTHPLGYGYGEAYFSLKLDTTAFGYLDEGWNVGVAEGDAFMSGFVGQRAREKLENTLAFGVQEMGDGTVVYLIDNPLFRAFWQNGKLLFGNAVFMVGQ